MPINLVEKPVFIIGAERSGTTLMMTMLGCHPRLAVPEVAWLYPRFYPYLHTYGDLNNIDNFRTLTAEIVFSLKTPFWGMNVNPRTIVDEIISNTREQSFAGIFCSLLEKYAEYINKPRWGEKTPYNLFFIEGILRDFPNAQFIHMIRDGRDASASFLEAPFGPTNIYCAATVWKLSLDAVKTWREKLKPSQWLDVYYETLVHEPEEVLNKICNFLGEDYSPNMLKFYETEIAKKRSGTKAHTALNQPISSKSIGRYKELLSIRQQRIFAGVAGEELEALGYRVDVEPLYLTTEEKDYYEELDGRIRAATLDAPGGHIIYESIGDWLNDRREERKKKGIWSKSESPQMSSEGQFYEELITGQRAWMKWKKHFCVKRQYIS